MVGNWCKGERTDCCGGASLWKPQAVAALAQPRLFTPLPASQSAPYTAALYLQAPAAFLTLEPMAPHVSTENSRFVMGVFSFVPVTHL